MRRVGRETHHSAQPHQPYLPHLPHLPFFALFALLTLGITWPLPAWLASGVVGAPGDNLSFVWNFWWAQSAIATARSVWWTPALFAPIGTSLATHTFVPLFSVGAALVLPHVPPVVLYNSSLLLSVFLNFVCAYAAANTVTNDRLASAYAAIVFGAAPFLGIRLEGHLSVLSAWGLPLAFALSTRWLRHPTLPRTLALSIGLAAIAYTDYYYFIFAVVLVALMVIFARRSIDVALRPLTPARKGALTAIGALLSIVLLAIVTIAATGGTDTTVVGIRVRMTDTFNARVIAGFLVLLLPAIWAWPSIRIQRREEARPFPTTAMWTAAVALAVLIVPLLVASYAVWSSGDYSSQVYVWRNAPPGIDLATFALGNQLNPLTGGATAAAYRRFGINGVEGAAWLGIVPTLLLVPAWTLRSRRDVTAAFWIGGVFLLWSLGPYLRILNYNTGLMLPETILRFVPVLANARIPGRAFVVVQLQAAMLGAMALAAWRERSSPSAQTGQLARSVRSSRFVRVCTCLLIAAVLADYWPGRRTITELTVPPLYATLRDLPAGNVLEVPFGIRDGFGEHGALDHRVLFYQTVHGHSEMGGFVARLSKKTESAFESDPITGAILNLSEQRPAQLAAPCRSSLACSTRYVVVDRKEASPELQAFIAGAFALRPISSDEERTLYGVEHLPACACP